MRDKTIKACAGIMTVLVVIVCALMFYFSENHAQIVQAREQKELQRVQEENFLSSMDGLEMLDYYTDMLSENETDDQFEQQIRIELPSSVKEQDILIENQYITRTISIQIPTGEQDYFYEHPMVGKSANIDRLDMELNGSMASIELEMDHVYEVQTSYEDGYLYMDFVRPEEIYEKIVVIDAGHGGNDPGAIGGKDVYEKDIDLAILEEVKNLFDEQEEIKVYYTRTEDVNPSLFERAALANDVGADYFISIHNNTLSRSSAKYVNGTEVMYNELNTDGRSEALAQLCLTEVCGVLSSEDQGLEEGSSIYIIRSSEAPVALIEVGFMSNADELQRLQNAEYQQQAAQGIYDAIRKAYEAGI